MSSIEKAMQRQSDGDKSKSSTIEAALEKKKQEQAPVVDDAVTKATSEERVSKPVESSAKAADSQRGLGDGITEEEINQLDQANVSEAATVS